MLPDNLKENATATALEAFDSSAVVTAKFERGELTVEVAPDKITSVCGFLKFDLGFVRLSTVTGADWYPAEPRFEVIYHLHSLDRNERLRVKCRLAGSDPQIDSVTGVWRAANWFERETFDLFGIRFRNHPDLRRIMMPEDWQGYPLRKDYNITGDRV